MAASRIVDYDAKNKTMIHYYYEDHRTKERVDVEETVLDFMKKLLIHIREAQFKMIRYYCLYATCEHEHKGDVEKILSNKKNRTTKLKAYRQQLIETFDTDHLLCNWGQYGVY